MIHMKHVYYFLLYGFFFIIRIYIENYSAGIVDEYTPPHDVIQVTLNPTCQSVCMFVCSITQILVTHCTVWQRILEFYMLSI